MNEKDKQDNIEKDIFSSFGEEVSKEEIEIEKLPEEEKAEYESTDPYWDIPPPEIKKKGISEQQKRRMELAKIRLQVDQLLASDPYFDIKSPVEEKEPVNVESEEEEEEEIEIEQTTPPKSSPFNFTAIPLTGKLRMAIDGTQLSEGDMQVMKNLRYGRKSPKSISGMTKINTSIFYSEFSNNIPQHDYLIGWYKFDEGSGAIAANSATDGVLGGGLLPDLDVNGDLDIFWDTSVGFGYSGNTEPIGLPTCWASKILSSTRTIGADFGVGIFFKRIEQTAPGGWIFELNTSTTETIVFIQNRTAVGTPSTYDFQFEDTLVQSVWEMVTFDWHFLFLDSLNYPRIIKPDGTMVSGDLELTKFAFTLNDLVVGAYYSVGDYGGGSYGAFGDWIIYNNYSPTLSVWAEWYDEFRTRYGMSARSEW